MIIRLRKAVPGRFLKIFSLFPRHYKKDRQPLILPLPNTNVEDIGYGASLKTINCIEELRVPTLVGGKARRAELNPSLSTDARLQVAKTEHRKQIQKRIVQTALNIALKGISKKRGCLILDLGCGGDMTSMYSDVSGGHFVLGLDNVVNETITSLHGENFDVVQADMSRPVLPLRSGVFDAVVSVSALQCLFVSDAPCQLLESHFRSLYAMLRQTGTAALQFYPRSPRDVENVLLTADVYFKGALIADYPHPDRGKKLFLYLIKS